VGAAFVAELLFTFALCDVVLNVATGDSHPDNSVYGLVFIRDVLDDAVRSRLVGKIVGHLRDGVTEPVLQRAFQHWRNVDKDLCGRVEQGVRASRADRSRPSATSLTHQPISLRTST
jgi:hypothetical protein